MFEISVPRALSEGEEKFPREPIDRDMTGMEVTVTRIEQIERLDSGKTRVARNRWLGDEEVS